MTRITTVFAVLAALAGCTNSSSTGNVSIVLPVTGAQTAVSGVTVSLVLEQDSLPITVPVQSDLSQLGDVATAQLAFEKVPYGLTRFVVEFEWLQPGGAQSTILRAEKEVDLDEPNEVVDIGQEDIVLNADTDRDGVSDLSELLQGRDPLEREECAANTDCSIGSVCTNFECVPLNCGNNLIDGTGERCDGADLGTATCMSQGFDGGTLACGMDCKFDTSGCTGTGFECGDGSLDGDEVCESGGTMACTAINSTLFVGGVATCDLSDCLSFDTSGCITCGNGSIETGEDCDGTTFMGGDSCQMRGFPGGNLSCTAQCAVSTANCDAPNTCPDGDVDPGEQCDGADLDGNDCTTLQGPPTFEGGTLACNPNCSFDTSGCYRCGDNVTNGDEECDGTDIPETCDDITGFPGSLGTPSCTSCIIDPSDCSFCGNDVVESPREECDTVPNLTCSQLTSGMFPDGTPTCNASCKHDASTCTNGSCIPLAGPCNASQTCCGEPDNTCDFVLGVELCCADEGSSCASGPCCDGFMCIGEICVDPSGGPDGGGGDGSSMCADLDEDCTATMCCPPYSCGITQLCEEGTGMMPD